MKIAALIRFCIRFPLRKILSHEECVVLCILECEASTTRHSSKRVVCYIERNVNLLAETLCKTSEELSATCEVDTVFNDVGIKLRWSLLQYVENTGLDSCHRLVKTVRNLLVSDCCMHRMSCHEVRTSD